MKYLKNEFPEVFSEWLGRCTKTKVKFEIKENAKPISKPKRNVPFAVWEPINKELVSWKFGCPLKSRIFRLGASDSICKKEKSQNTHLHGFFNWFKLLL